MDKPQVKRTANAMLKSWLSPRSWRFWIVLILLAYTLGGFFGAPWLLERMATKKVAELDRKLSFGDIKVNPFLLTLQMLDTKLHDSDGVLLFSYDDYFFDLQTSSLFRWAWTFREIRLSGLRVNWERFAPGDDRFGRLMDSFPADPEPKAEATSEGLPRLVIHLLQISQARVGLDDHMPQGNFSTELGPINIEVANLSTLPDQAGQQQVHIVTRAGGEIAWQGSLQLSPIESAGQVTIKGRIFADLDQYLALFTSAKLKGEGEDVAFSYHIEQAADKEINVTVQDFNASFNNWQLFLPNESEPLVNLPQLQIFDGKLRWPQQTLDLAKVTLLQPSLKLVMLADGSLNLDQLLAELANKETGEETGAESGAEANSSSSAKPWQLSIGQFGIEQATVQLDDLSTEPPARLGLQDINLAVSDISNQDAAILPLQASFSLASGGSGNFDGQAVVLPEFSSSGQFQLDGLQLQVAQPWLNSIARVTLNSGQLTLNGEVKTGPEQPGSYQGSVAISELDVSDNRQKEKLTGWKQLDIERVEVDLAANTVKTSEVKLDQPYGRFQIAADRSTNLDGLMIETATAANTNASAESTAQAVEIDEAADEVSEKLAITLAGFKIDDAGLDFSDLTLPLPFMAAIRSMDGTISTLATNSEESARVSLEGQVNEYGLARINGSLNAWSPESFTDIQMTFRNLEMERMTPYTIEFAGWEIAAGRMDLDLDYKINESQLHGTNDIVIRELTVGDKVESPSGASLPLKFAVALLKDSNGVIDVDLPVEGNLNDPSFKMSGIIWKAIGNLLLKVATAPFRLLGSLVGVDSEDFGTLQFSAGEVEISPPDREQLVKLAEAMRQRPELKLEVAGSYVVELDQPALQTRQVDERIAAGIAGLPASGDQLITVQRRQVLEQIVSSTVPTLDLLILQQQFSKIPEGEDPEKATAVLDETAYLEGLRQQLIEAEPVSEAALQALAEARADAVVAALAGDGTTSPLPLTRLPPEAVDAADSGEVPLELKVEVAAE